MLYCYIVQRCKCNRWLFPTNVSNRQAGAHLSKKSNQISSESNVGSLSITGKKGTLKFEVGLGVGLGVELGVGVGLGLGLGVALGLGVGVGVALGLGVGVRVGLGVEGSYA